MSTREWKGVLRRDPCSYCGGPGGTVDHIDPRPVTANSTHLRGVTANLTGACAECNRRKDKGRDHRKSEEEDYRHRSVLMCLWAINERPKMARRKRKFHHPGTWLMVGDLVGGPFFHNGTIISIDPLLVEIPDREDPWKVMNPLCLQTVNR